MSPQGHGIPASRLRYDATPTGRVHTLAAAARDDLRKLRPHHGTHSQRGGGEHGRAA
jgi:hypothetical protein